MRCSAIPTIILSALFHTAAMASGNEHSAHWGYKGANAANHWGEMKPEFATCKEGKSQSPINISSVDAEKRTLEPIKFNYNTSPLKIINNGHTIQVNYETGSYIRIGSDRYELLQFHFHTPSEEQIDGKNYDMVAHLVHKNSEGKLAVVAVLFDRGLPHPALDNIWSAIPTEEGKEVTQQQISIQATRLLPNDRDYYTFTGSLTTPPCSEGVRWLVLKQPVTLSTAQMNRFKDFYSFNARPVQPLNGRQVLLSR